MTEDRNYKLEENQDVYTLETTYNEDSNSNNVIFIIENWEQSAELYQEYLNWRMTEDPSGLVSKIIPLLVGGESCWFAFQKYGKDLTNKIINPNTRYKIYHRGFTTNCTLLWLDRN